MDQLPCGSVLAPVLSCTKFKIYPAHADSPMAKTFKSPSPFFSKDQSLLHRSRNSERECRWWTNFLVGQFLHQLSLVRSSRSIQRMQTVPWPKHLNLLHHFFCKDQSLLHRSKTQEEKVAGGPTPLWVCLYTSYLLYKV